MGDAADREDALGRAGPLQPPPGSGRHQLIACHFRGIGRDLTAAAS
ncbi:MAG: hypothetical protein M3Y71_05835 [Actinomycetota bacterium]|nr:hypothetical protein [Actinomycetota bacterium]